VRDQLIAQEKIATSSGLNLQAEQGYLIKIVPLIKKYLPVPLKNILKKIRKYLS
jgi:hypothetical protein